MQNNLNKLKQRYNDLIEHGRIGAGVIDNQLFEELKCGLSICLPNDFLKISEHMAYFDFSFMDFWEPLETSNTILFNNLEIRKIYTSLSNKQSDMSHILILADNDGGSVFMITQDSPEKPTPIIWCDYGDMYYYSIHKKFQYPHDEWPSFTAFFEYLVEREEEALKEDGREAE